VGSAIDQLDGGCRQRITHGARHKYFVGLRGTHDACRGVHIQTADLFAASLTRAYVNAGADAQSERMERQPDGRRAADRGRDGIEDREKPVARGVDFAPAEAPQRAPDSTAVAGQ